jgi:hypothetical protein
MSAIFEHFAVESTKGTKRTAAAAAAAAAAEGSRRKVQKTQLVEAQDADTAGASTALERCSVPQSVLSGFVRVAFGNKQAQADIYTRLFVMMPS